MNNPVSHAARGLDFAALIIALCLACATAWGEGEQMTYPNPIIRGMNPDPSICRVGEDFYLVTSTFEYFPGLPIYQSKDLVHWKLIGHALSRANNCPLLGCGSGGGGNYAPTIRYSDGTFYVLCTNYGGQGSQGVFYVSAKDPAGPWSDPVWVGSWNVDPSCSFDDGKMYWLSPNNNDGFLLGVWDPKRHEFSKDLQKIALGLGGSSPEGPHLYKINNYYYLMSAEGGTGFQHREVIQRSATPWGPYEKSPYNPVLSNKDEPSNPFQAIGHADLFQLADGSWWAVCLGFRTVEGRYHYLGRETFLAPVTWTADGWPKVGTDGVVQEQYEAPKLPAHEWEILPARDDFNQPQLALSWNFIRNPHKENWSLTARPGFLRLKGSWLSFKQKDSPAFIGRRQDAFNAAISARLEFEPKGKNEEAGLVIRSTDENHLDFVVTKANGKKAAVLRRVVKGMAETLQGVELPEGGLTLRIQASLGQYAFFIQADGQEEIPLGTSPAESLSTEAAGGFTGVYIGMYASGNGTSCRAPADFDWFEYQG
jgi:alpha-N-arabinofuranosidase